MVQTAPLKGERVSLPDDLDAIFDEYYSQGWTDGLPIVPPTEARVRAMLQYADRDPNEVFSYMAPSLWETTIERIAVNCVMAGCKPEYFPVVLAALQAMEHKQFNLMGIQATTHPCGAMVFLSGPIAKELNVNAGSGCLGPGWRANATIGRALRLVMLNCGGATPGPVDKATHGQPGKFSYCFAENEDESPWEPFRVEHGYPKDVTTVTVGAMENPHNINDHVSNHAEGVLITACDSIATMGSNQTYTLNSDFFVCFGPEHATIIAKDGFSKEDVRRYIYENARLPMYKRQKGGMWSMLPMPKWFSTVDDHALVPVVTDMKDIHIIMAGGAGKHSCWMSSVGISRSVTVPIAKKDGTPVKSIKELARR
ncbi:MAG: hypothetical protein HYX97_00575 [Chloroflexi bacterium]|nr:hypothetical protein [Chloroflexota bacterium]